MLKSNRLKLHHDMVVRKVHNTCEVSALAALISLCAVTLFLPPKTLAAVRLPLQGYCRPGRYFPIEIDQAGSITFTAQGALSVEVQANTRLRTIAPMLLLGSAGDLHWPGGSMPLRVPGDRERLVASTTSTATASDLFPGDRILPIQLDPADPLPGPPVAWEALDAIVLDADTMARINPSQRSALLAGGVLLAVAGTEKPDDRWPWHRRGSLWVLAYASSGPVEQSIDPDAYAPTFAWAPGRSATIREQVAGAAILLFLAIVALAMLRNRWAIIGLMVVSLGSAGAIAAWHRALGVVSGAGGDVIVVSPTLIQRDAWVFERGGQTSDQVLPWGGWVHPIFASTEAISETAMRITMAADNSISFNFNLQRGKTIAFLRREVHTGPHPTLTNARGSPMRELARSIYLQKGDRIMGETTAAGDRWPGAVVEMGNRANGE